MLTVVLCVVATIVVGGAWLLWAQWRREKSRFWAIWSLKISLRLARDPETRLAPNVVDTAERAARRLLRDVARAVHQPLSEVERALFADTGARSIADALQAPAPPHWFVDQPTSLRPMSVEDRLIDLAYGTRSRVRLTLQHLIETSARWPHASMGLRANPSRLKMLDRLFLGILLLISLIALGLAIVVLRGLSTS
jgi:hypothetical protein